MPANVDIFLTNHGKALPSRGCRSGKDNGLMFSESALENIKHELIIFNCICIVHSFWVRTIIEGDICVWYTLSEVSLQQPKPHLLVKFIFVHTHFKTIDAQVDQIVQFVCIPFSRIWVRDIDYTHTRLPKVPLPRSSINTLDKVTIFSGFIENW